MQLYSRVFLAIIASFLLSRCQQDHDRIDHCVWAGGCLFLLGGLGFRTRSKVGVMYPKKCYSYDLIGTALCGMVRCFMVKTASGQTYDQYKFTATSHIANTQRSRGY